MQHKSATEGLAVRARHAQQNIASDVEMRVEVVSALRTERVPFLEWLGGQRGTSSGEADHCAQVDGQESDRKADHGQEVDSA